MKPQTPTEKDTALLLVMEDEETEISSASTDVPIKASSPDSIEFPFSYFTWILLNILCVCIYASYSIFVHLCEKNGKLPFNPAAVVFLIECTKFLLSLLLFGRKILFGNSLSRVPYCFYEAVCQEILKVSQLRSKTKLKQLNTTVLVQTILPFLVPAVLYACSNNLSYHILKQMDPVSYQVLSNLKILTTALLFRLFLKRPISRLQWLALLLLMAGSMLDGISSEVGPQRNSSKTETNPQTTGNMSASYLHITYLGIALMFLYTCLSGFTGVYTEYILKKLPEMNIDLQNALLYTFGMTINGSLFVFSCWKENRPLYLFDGFSLFTWLIILTQSMVGIFFGYVFKYATNITRLFIIGCSMLLTTVLAMIIWGLAINPLFCLTAILILLALYLYHLK